MPSGWQHLLSQGDEELIGVCSGQEACYVTLPRWCDIICEVWRPDWCQHSFLQLVGVWKLGECHQHKDLPCVPMGGLTFLLFWEPEKPSCWPSLWASPSDMGGSPFLQGLCWFVCKTQGSVMHSTWCATLRRCPGFVLRYKTWLLNSIEWF